MWADGVLARCRAKTISDSSSLHVADIGCGNGAVSWPFVRYFSENIPFVYFWLVDRDVRAYKGIRSLMEENLDRSDKYSNISYSFLTASATYIPLKTNSCQAIICRNLLHWLDTPDILLALGEIYRILSPGGLAIVDTRTVYSSSNVCVDGVVNEQLLADVHEHMTHNPNDIMRRYAPRYQRNMSFFTKASFTRVLREAGYATRTVQTYRPPDFPNGLEDPYRPGICAIIEKDSVPKSDDNPGLGDSDE